MSLFEEIRTSGAVKVAQPVTAGVSMEKQMKKDLQKLCKKTGFTMSVVIRYALQKFLEEQQ